jgi:hypothetical protein
MAWLHCDGGPAAWGAEVRALSASCLPQGDEQQVGLCDPRGQLVAARAFFAGGGRRAVWAVRGGGAAFGAVLAEAAREGRAVAAVVVGSDAALAARWAAALRGKVTVVWAGAEGGGVTAAFGRLRGLGWFGEACDQGRLVRGLVIEAAEFDLPGLVLPGCTSVSGASPCLCASEQLSGATPCGLVGESPCECALGAAATFECSPLSCARVHVVGTFPRSALGHRLSLLAPHAPLRVAALPSYEEAARVVTRLASGGDGAALLELGGALAVATPEPSGAALSLRLLRGLGQLAALRHLQSVVPAFFAAALADEALCPPLPAAELESAGASAPAAASQGFLMMRLPVRASNKLADDTEAALVAACSNCEADEAVIRAVGVKRRAQASSQVAIMRAVGVPPPVPPLAVLQNSARLKKRRCGVSAD